MSFRKLIDLKGNRNGTVVRALAFHHCGLGFIPKPHSPHVGLGCYWFSSLLQEFFSRPSGFPPSTKTNIPNSNLNGKQSNQQIANKHQCQDKSLKKEESY